MNRLLFVVYIILFYIIGFMTVWIVNNVLEFNFDIEFVLVAPILPAIIAGIISHFIIKKLM